MNTYPVMESFYTLQGEGYHQGRAAWFLRLGGCDVGCVWCDVKESWDASKFPSFPANGILPPSEMPVGMPGSVVVVTGGEPLMYNCETLTRSLQERGFSTHLETSGAYPLTGVWNWICVSPKKFKAPLPEVLAKASELKVVVFHKSDFAWAEKQAAVVPAGCKLYLQPEWDKKDEITPLVTEYIKQHPQWQLSVQLHKYINVP
jgi:7-carboxy-7-deazaguanine synthase